MFISCFLAFLVCFLAFWNEFTLKSTVPKAESGYRQVLDRFEEIGLSVYRQEVDGDWAAVSLIQDPDKI